MDTDNDDPVAENFQEPNPALGVPCAYCQQAKVETEFTLEHAIPQFLGGAQAPDIFRLRNVCKFCNNNLGTFVDGAYAKSWPVSHALANAAWRAYDSTTRPLPLSCVGTVDLDGVRLPKVCSDKHEYLQEMWVGPSGETLLWIRPKDDELAGYVGGNPLHKKLPTTAYWLPTSNDAVRLKIGLQSLGAMFKARRRSRLVLGCAADDPEGVLTAMGFVAPDDIDRRNIESIQRACRRESIRARIALQISADQRFLSKLALGVGLGLFGDTFSATAEARELRRGIWPQKESNIRVRGQGGLALAGSEISQHCSLPGVVVLAVVKTGEDYALTLTIDASIAATVALAPVHMSPCVSIGETGYALLLVPYLDWCMETTLAALLAHRLGVEPLAGLAPIEAQFARALTFNASLAPMRTSGA